MKQQPFCARKRVEYGTNVLSVCDDAASDKHDNILIVFYANFIIKISLTGKCFHLQTIADRLTDTVIY